MLKLICLAVLACGAYAIVCPPNICDTMDCAAMDSCNGLVKKNGGFCGCCDSCITQLVEGDACSTFLLLGVPSTESCGDGLYCDQHTHRCHPIVKRDLGPCAQRLAEVNAQLDASQHMLLGLEKPHCDTNGNYLGMQFSGSQAYCVTEDGTMINGYMVNRWETGDSMTCQCARDQYKYMQSGLIGKMFNCAPNGNYASVGCTGSVCYCIDQSGNQVGVSTIPIGQQDALNC
ncbi:uncharacterized protein LOC128240908 [Mya arenaria]|uniref:uncharacterized protein LOC128240908 n=1 Tax=Mya arenaria TaxID=6604 RepID=UPI0022E20CE5|nr:uncharacterized protein LOC128240908 [Mya arenaria]